MIDQALFEKIHDALNARNPWELKQLDWYRLRYTGYGRPSLPYPNAPDMHYPLTDTMIEKIKPFYIQQIYGQEKLANFVDMGGTDQPVADRENKFDRELKQNSNFEIAAHTFVDKMLNYGINVVKTVWNDKEKRLEFVPVDAIHIIVPPGTVSIHKTEWLVHIIRMTEGQYRANEKFTQDDELIKRIKGKGAISDGKEEQRELEIEIREGITGSRYDDAIILWEVYWKKNVSDKEWTVSTVSPLAGVEDAQNKIADDFKLPFDKGVFAKGDLPFTEFTYEAATEGFYSPRGLAEILEPYELDLCKLWNYKLQFLDFNAQPTYFIAQPTANMMNFSNAPGSVRPFGIEKDAPIEAPVDIAASMEMTRALAEDRVAIPDLGNSLHLPGNDASTQKGQVTATQINAIVGFTNQSNDLRSKLFKSQLQHLFRHADSILEQYLELPPRQVEIIPSGSADAWNKAARSQKMLALFQVLQGRPNVDQDELVKLILEQDSPELVKRLYRDSGEHTEDEQEKEADAITKMLIGFSPEVRPDEDAAIRIDTLAQFIQRRFQTGEPVTPEFARLALMRGEQHLQILQAQKNPQLPQIMQQVGPIVQRLQLLAQQPDQMGGTPPPQPPQAGAQGQPPAGAGQGAKESVQINYKDAPPFIQAQMERAAGFIPDPMHEKEIEAQRQAPIAATAIPPQRKK